MPLTAHASPWRARLATRSALDVAVGPQMAIAMPTSDVTKAVARAAAWRTRRGGLACGRCLFAPLGHHALQPFTHLLIRRLINLTSRIAPRQDVQR